MIDALWQRDKNKKKNYTILTASMQVVDCYFGRGRKIYSDNSSDIQIQFSKKRLRRIEKSENFSTKKILWLYLKFEYQCEETWKIRLSYVRIW